VRMGADLISDGGCWNADEAERTDGGGFISVNQSMFIKVCQS